MSKSDFLVEIGTEELPPTALLKLSTSFAQQIKNGIQNAGLHYDQLHTYATPRRLAVVVTNLDTQTPEKNIVTWGPPRKIAFDEEGKPSKAAIAFAKKNNLNVDQLQCEHDGKAEKLVTRSVQAGQLANVLLPQIVITSLDKLPIAKRMRWGASRIEFVRPVQWITMLLDSSIINCEILGLQSSNITRGHRFHCDTTLEIANPLSYESLLKDSGHIIADYQQRKQLIREQVLAEGKNIGGIAVIDESLLDEVTGLVEWPVALTGSFEQRFLNVPAEALISSMSEHQKYFHVVDKDGNLMPHFITVSNIASNDPAQVISGNERVIRPRLADAAFFFETDKKVSLETRLEKLKSVVFQEKLGTVYDKTQRIKQLAGYIAKQLSTNEEHAQRAAELSKADLVSDMVLEFDKMQGIAGRYYAIADGEAVEVADAIRDQYLPKFSGDKLPTNLTACAVALADRLDTIVGIFGIGQPPTGSKDPFALRRSTLGVLRIIVEKNLNLDLKDLINTAQSLHNNLPASKGLTETVLAYMIERFRSWYEEDNIPAEVFMAVSAKELSTPLDIDRRVKAVHHFSQLPEAQALAAANKRVSNILAKLNDVTLDTDINESLLHDNAEQQLALLISAKTEQLKPLWANQDYKQVLENLADLREPVDVFFEKVMVMVDDKTLRNNRLALLSQLQNLFLQVADISLLVPAK